MLWGFDSFVFNVVAGLLGGLVGLVALFAYCCFTFALCFCLHACWLLLVVVLRFRLLCLVCLQFGCFGFGLL